MSEQRKMHNAEYVPLKMFVLQPVHCTNCGKPFMSKVEKKFVTCSPDCYDELNWKDTLYYAGKEYYPRSEAKLGNGFGNRITAKAQAKIDADKKSRDDLETYDVNKLFE